MANPVVNLIKAIYVDRYDYPLYDDRKNPVQYYFSNGKSVVWESSRQVKAAEPDDGFVASDDNRQSRPLAVVQNTAFTVELAEGVVSKLKDSYSKTFELQGTYEGRCIFRSGQISVDKSTIVVQLAKDEMPKPLPWGLVGIVTWILGGKQYQQATEVEIYVFPEHLPAFYNDCGISLPLLRNRSLFPKWMSSARNMGWPEFVVRAIFNDFNLQYDCCNGASKYVTLLPEKPAQTDLRNEKIMNLNIKELEVEFWIDLFTLDCSHQTSVQQVNCNDVAAICQALIALGVEPSADLRMVHLEPYGFIKPTKLIGHVKVDDKNPQGLCNNPVYMSEIFDPAMLCSPSSRFRSLFNQHTFVSIKVGPKVCILDACAGPHTGTEDLAEYKNNAIDLRGESMDDTPPWTGRGITRLVTSRVFEQKSSVGSPSFSLLDSLARNIEIKGQWTQPFLSVPFVKDRTTATWTFAREDGTDTYTINLYNYRVDEKRSAQADFAALDFEFDQRKAFAPNFQVIDQTRGFTDECAGSLFLWYDKPRLYMVSIEAEHGKATKGGANGSPPLEIFQKQFERELNKYLDSRPADLKTPVVQLQGLAVTDRTGGNPQKQDVVVASVGSFVYFITESSNKDLAKNYWRGFQAQSKQGTMLCLGAIPAADGTETRFKLLARRAGDDVVTFSMFGSDMRVVQRDVKFRVS